MKKVLAMALMLMLLTTSFAMADIARISEEPIHLKVMVKTGEGTLDYKNTFVMKWVEENLGFDFEIDHYAKDVYLTQLTLMLAEDNLPDLLCDFDYSKLESNKYGDEGYFLDMSEYLDYMPNFVAFCESHPDFAAYTKTSDGKIYGVNRCRDTLVSRQLSHNWMSKAWLANVGKEVPATLDELYDVLVAFKEQDANGNGDPNDEIPFSLTFDGQSGQRVEFILKAAFGVYSCSMNYQLQADSENKVYLAETTENWKNYLTYMHKLYAEGLLDNECYTQTTDEFHAKMYADRVGFFGDWNEGLFSTWEGKDASYEKEFAYICYFNNVETGENNITLYPNYTSNTRNMISASTEYPIQCCQLIDLMFNDEFIVIANFGIEGETYDIVTDEFGNTIRDRTPYYEKMKDEYSSYSEWERQYLIPGKFYNMVLFSEGMTIVSNATDEELEAYIAAENAPDYLSPAIHEKGRRGADNFYDSFPFLVYTTEESDRISTLKTDLTTYLKSMKAQFITGELDIEENWDAFQAQIQSFGLDTILEVEQAAYDRFAVNLK